MGYPSSTAEEDVLACDSPGPSKDVVIYNCAVHIYPNGHVCASLGRIDLGSRRFISEKLSCRTAAGSSRREALTLLQQAVSEALLDLQVDTA